MVLNTSLATVPQIPVQMWDGKRVVRYDDIAHIHGVPSSRVAKAFQRHCGEMLEGKDYYRLNHKDIMVYAAQFGNSNRISKNASHMRVFTESGYFILACSFRDEKTAFIRRALIDGYFQGKKVKEQVKNAIPNQLLLDLA